MKKVAVTGANGMIGRHMVALLRHQNIDCLALDRQDWDLSLWKTIAELDHLFKDVCAIFHFGAALPSPRTNTESNASETQTLFDVNVRSCLNIAEWATLRDKPFIFLSGSTVYQDTNASQITESAPKVQNGFGGFYGYSKLLAEKVIQHFIPIGLRAAILRPSSVYGYGLAQDKIVSRFLSLASQNLPVMVTEPNNAVGLIHALDVAKAALAVCRKEAWGTYNISGEAPVSFETIATACVAAMNSGKVQLDPGTDEKSRFRRFDLNCSKAKKSFGFNCQISLEEGLHLMQTKQLIPSGFLYVE